jgi:hypothetical protein
MPNTNPSKYSRPGIFVEEFDNSVITTPQVIGTTPLVIGFSRKGPVNTPILLQNQNDLTNVFGILDRNLERKGSFFHRTVSKMLETNNCFAINLLETDPVLDQIQYIGMSTAAQYDNDIIRTNSYSKFFDTTGFWKRDTLSFLNIVKNDPNASQRVLNFTNMSGSNITIFTFKTVLTTFDQPLSNYYVQPSTPPSYTNPTDYASDYMIDILVIQGNWTNYQNLSVDAKYGTYFDVTGLRKTQVQNFLNDRSVNVLKYYQGLSLIPFFRDSNNTNIFVETVVNRDTDLTGLFCAFNAELLETDYPNGLIDLIGNSLINDEDNITNIDFLSYNDTIIESLSYPQVLLDTPGNVISMGVSGSNNLFRLSASGSTTRTAYFAEGFVSGVISSGTSSTYLNVSIPGPSFSSVIVGSYGATSSILGVTISVAAGAYSVVGGAEIDTVQGTYSMTFSAANYIVASGTSSSFMSVFTLNTSGQIVRADNLSNNTNLSVNATDIVLGYANVSIFNNSVDNINYFTQFNYTPVTVNAAGFIELKQGSTLDYTMSGNASTGVVTFTFNNTNVVPDTSQYVVNRRIKEFNYISNFLTSPNVAEMVVIDDIGSKHSLAGMSVTNVVTSTSLNKSFTLNTNILAGITNLVNGNLLLYIVDNEFIMDATSLITKNTLYNNTTPGIVARYSQFYTDFVAGNINTGDFFYENLLSKSYNVLFEDISGQSYIIFSGQVTAPTTFVTNSKIILPSAVTNTGTFTIEDPNNYAAPLGLTGSFAYKIAEAVTTETVLDAAYLYNALNKHYLEMYLDSNLNLTVDFMDSLIQTPNPIVNLANNTTIFVSSQKSNYRETVEIAQPTTYVQTPNKVLVNGARYTQVKIGDFLEAYVDPTTVVAGEIPKHLTRILSKKVWSGDTTLVEITCDATVKLYNYNGDLQTYRFTDIGDYINTYKGVTLAGFRIRQASIPDGTETRQASILSLLDIGTPLFNAITDKENITFRYLVDSFGLGLTEFSKQQLADICGTRLDCFGFLNMPSMRSFRESTSPSFVDANGVLSTAFIAVGGDPSSSPAFLYSFAQGIGDTSVGYFAPYVTTNDNGTPVSVPPAMFVANAYLRKFNTTQTNIFPWTIVAGITNGRLTGITSLEMSFNNQDIINLNTMKANPLVFKRNRGYVIETENTAQTLFTSSLSFIHSREVLIELEYQLSQMLLEFQWKFNTPDVRAEIKFRADNITAQFINQQALYNAFNKCDAENNTQAIIDQQAGVLDTYVEIVKGMGIIVNNITILRTNTINSSGFQPL